MICEAEAHLAVDDGLGHGEDDGLADSAHIGGRVLCKLLQIVIKHLQGPPSTTQPLIAVNIHHMLHTVQVHKKQDNEMVIPAHLGRNT
jgi:hypothetical protein